MECCHFFMSGKKQRKKGVVGGEVLEMKIKIMELL